MHSISSCYPTNTATTPHITIPLRRSSRLSNVKSAQPQQYVNYMNVIPVYSLTVVNSEPSTYKQAINRADSDRWIDAMKQELHSLYKHKTGTLVLRPNPVQYNVLPNRWVYRIKYDAIGNIIKYKVRLVVKGYKQRVTDIQIQIEY